MLSADFFWWMAEIGQAGAWLLHFNISTSSGYSFGMKMMSLLRILSVMALVVYGSIEVQAATLPAPELVLRDYARLELDTPVGKVLVHAGKGLERTYEWDGCSLSSSVFARRSRWYGSLGAYDPAGRFGPIDALRDKFRACKGISRTVVEEGQIHFDDEQAAEAWIKRYSTISTTVWTNDGLLAQWRIVPSRDQFSFDLWRICVRGLPPKKLGGAKDDAIKVFHKDGPSGALHECARVGAEVVAETQKVWQEHWKQVDEWNARAKRQ